MTHRINCHRWGTGICGKYEPRTKVCELKHCPQMASAFGLLRFWSGSVFNFLKTYIPLWHFWLVRWTMIIKKAKYHSEICSRWVFSSKDKNRTSGSEFLLPKWLFYLIQSWGWAIIFLKKKKLCMSPLCSLLLSCGTYS